MVCMSMFNAILLGIVQGITEFIPVSSTGHLVLMRDALSLPLYNSLAFDAVLHLATSFAVIVYFRKDIWNLLVRAGQHKVLWGALILGTIPAALLGFFFEDTIAHQFRSPEVVMGMLVLGSILFVAAEFFARQNSVLTKRKGFLIGLFQSTALIPGVSRSGATISGGLLFGLQREAATRFSFLLGLPILLGVGGMKLFALIQNGSVTGGDGTALLVGSVVAFAVGLGAIHFMIRFLRNHGLHVFALYRVLLALMVLFLLVS